MYPCKESAKHTYARLAVDDGCDVGGVEDRCEDKCARHCTELGAGGRQPVEGSPYLFGQQVKISGGSFCVQRDVDSEREGKERVNFVASAG